MPLRRQTGFSVAPAFVDNLRKEQKTWILSLMGTEYRCTCAEKINKACFLL